jgi:hypothetical protein
MPAEQRILKASTAYRSAGVVIITQSPFCAPPQLANFQSDAGFLSSSFDNNSDTASAEQ